ncbi:MAG: carbohydrate ABC transporter permease [Gemmatimonadetes bacterium]|nr:MAG: carbohydrate ABC transporter permease [Gemmatimonadota bacterium]
MPNEFMDRLWKYATRTIAVLLVIFTIFGFLFPVYTVTVYPFSNEKNFPRENHRLVPPEWGQNGSLFYHFKDLFESKPQVLHTLKNSIIIAIATTFLSLVIAAPAAFGFSRFKFRGRMFFWWSFTFFIMLPDLLYANALYKMYFDLNLLNTYHGLIFIHSMRAIPYVLFVLYGIFQSIPTTLEEAAYTLGCNRFQTLVRVTIPMALPGVAVASIFAFLRSWDEFVLTMYLGGTETQTIVTLASSMLLGANKNPLQASTVSVIMMIPVIIFIFFTQKHMKAGYLAGAMARTY